MRDLFDHQPDCTVDDVELLKIGRQFRLSEQSKLTLGRHQKDNESIQAAAKEDYIILRTPGLAGPLGLVSGQPSEKDLQTAGAILASYCKGKEQKEVGVLAETPQGEKLFNVAPMPRIDSKEMAV